MLIYILHRAIDIFVILIIIRAIISWVPDLRYRFREPVRLLEAITDPVLKPLQRLIPPRQTGGFDISPILAIVALRILQRILL